MKTPGRWRRATTAAIARKKWQQLTRPWRHAWSVVGPAAMACWRVCEAFTEIDEVVKVWFTWFVSACWR